MSSFFSQIVRKMKCFMFPRTRNTESKLGLQGPTIKYSSVPLCVLIVYFKGHRAEFHTVQNSSRVRQKGGVTCHEEMGGCDR